MRLRDGYKLLPLNIQYYINASCHELELKYHFLGLPFFKYTYLLRSEVRKKYFHFDLESKLQNSNNGGTLHVYCICYNSELNNMMNNHGSAMLE